VDENKDGATAKGSRFAILGDNNGDDTLENNEETAPMNTGNFINREIMLLKENPPRKEAAGGERVTPGNKRGHECMQNEDFNLVNVGKSTRVNKLATRGSASFKGKSGQSAKKGSDNLADWMVTASIKAVNENNTEIMTNLGDKNSSYFPSATLGEVAGVQHRQGGVDNDLVSGDNSRMAQSKPFVPTMTKPPDPLTTHPLLAQDGSDTAIEKEDFVDATNQGYDSVDTTDMDFVGETPNLAQS
jgi:hypothetical protein